MSKATDMQQPYSFNHQWNLRTFWMVVQWNDAFGREAIQCGKLCSEGRSYNSTDVVAHVLGLFQSGEEKLICS